MGKQMHQSACASAKAHKGKLFTYTKYIMQIVYYSNSLHAMSDRYLTSIKRG